MTTSVLHHQSMPPMGMVSGSLRDSGIGHDDLHNPGSGGGGGGGGNLSPRDGDDRSSFGMILKDKFQKNPNMYFRKSIFYEQSLHLHIKDLNF